MLKNTFLTDGSVAIPLKKKGAGGDGLVAVKNWAIHISMHSFYH